MLKVFFVRHAQSKHPWEEDRTRPLTEEGQEDAHKVLEFLRDKNVHAFYCSPYKRSLDTITESAVYFNKEIMIDERFRERKVGSDGDKLVDKKEHLYIKKEYQGKILADKKII